MGMATGLLASLVEQKPPCPRASDTTRYEASEMRPGSDT